MRDGETQVAVPEATFLHRWAMQAEAQGQGWEAAPWEMGVLTGLTPRPPSEHVAQRGSLTRRTFCPGSPSPPRGPLTQLAGLGNTRGVEGERDCTSPAR